MSTVTVYSSAPLSTQLAVAFYKLSCQGVKVVLKPLSELPAARPKPHPSLYAQLEATCVELAILGDRLNEHETGRQCLGAGEEQGLRALRDALLARKRGIEGALRGQQGESSNG